MTDSTWKVELIGQSKRVNKNLSVESVKSFVFLLEELKHFGPFRHDWPNYTKMNGDDNYHCHLKKGRPTYVACWRIKDKKNKIIEVYYAGTHEKAPY